MHENQTRRDEPARHLGAAPGLVSEPLGGREAVQHCACLELEAAIVSRAGLVQARCPELSNEGLALVAPANATLAVGEALNLATLRRGDVVLMERVACSVQSVRQLEGSAGQLIWAAFETQAPLPPMRVTSRLRISTLLERASRLGTVFTVGPDDLGRARQLGGVTLAGGALHLLEPAPGEGPRLHAGQAVTLSFELGGRRLRGHTRVKHSAADALVVAVPLALLEVVGRNGLRAAPRSLMVKLVSPFTGVGVSRPILELSASGATFALDPSVDVFPPGARLEAVLVSADGRHLSCSATVTTLGREADGQQPCALQFAALSSDTRQALMDLLAQQRLEGVECAAGFPFQRISELFQEAGEGFRDHPEASPTAAQAHALLGDGAHGLSKSFVVREGSELAGHAAGLRIYSRTWLAQQPLVKSELPRAATRSHQLLSLGFDYGEALPDVEYVRGLWKVTSPLAERLHGAIAPRLLKAGLAYRVRFEPMRLALARPLPPGPLRVREAGALDEAAFFSSVGSSEAPLKLLSDELVPGELHLESLSRRYQALGLSRGRRLLVAEDAHGAPLGWALLETMSPGLFWPETFSSFRLFLVEPSGPQASAARHSLAAQAAAFYGARGLTEAECHASPTDVADLRKAGFVSLGAVYEFGAHRSVARELANLMLSLSARTRRVTKPD